MLNGRLRRADRGLAIALHSDAVVPCAYRPFCKQWLYFDSKLNEYPARIPHLFPKGRLPNIAITVDSRGSTKEFSALIVNTLPDYECISKGQCFPLYLYESTEESGRLDLGKKDGEVTKRIPDSEHIDRGRLSLPVFRRKSWTGGVCAVVPSGRKGKWLFSE